MALKINIKGGDSLLIATSKLTIASEGYTTVIIEGDLPVMRESESIKLHDANSPWKLICYHIQQHYLTGQPDLSRIVRKNGEILGSEDQEAYETILELLDKGQAFKALKIARRQAGL